VSQTDEERRINRLPVEGLGVEEQGFEGPAHSDIAERWLACATRMAAAGKAAAQPLQGTPAGRVMLGKGAGGDRTMEIDRACEAAMHEVLKAEAPAPYRLVSEESGISGDAGAPWCVVVDPLDGSLNAKRGLEPYCASIAVADRPGLDGVAVAYIEDYARPRAFAALRGRGRVDVGPAPEAWLPEDLRATAVDPSRFAARPIEVVLLEAGRPDRHRFAYQDLAIMGALGESLDMRIRQIGSLALSLCYVAMGVADILVAAVRSRSVDIAAGLLILREAGGGAAALGGWDIFQQPLDLEKRCAFVAWRAGLQRDEVVERSRRLETLLVAPE
jgi:myo-inositol-1(or 4)-monophosphatase